MKAKANVIGMVVYGVLGLTGVLCVHEFLASGVWRDALLLISGVLLGGFCASFVLVVRRTEILKEMLKEVRDEAHIQT